MNEHKQSTKRPRVLIVDDDPTTRMLLQESLKASGFDVDEAPDGEEALATYQQHPYSLVLMDVVMPKMDGFEVCERIRALPDGDEVPILMATSLEDIDSINRAYNAGATDFITKPIHWGLIGHRVRYMVRGGQMNHQLRSSEQRNRALLDAIPDAMCRVRSDGMCLEVRAARVTPLKPDAAGYRLREVLPQPVAERWLEALALALSTGEVRQIEFTLKPDGVTVYFEARIVAIDRHEAIVIVRDITRRKQMEEDLRTSEERFRSLIENASDMIMLLDGEGTFTYCSPSVSRTLEISDDELVGNSLEILLHDDDVPTVRNNLALARATEGSPQLANLRFRTARGSWRLMETICMSVHDDDGRVSIILNSRDVTDRVEAEFALRESEEQLRQSQKMEAVGRLAGGVAHDFNNLLTAILGYSQILDERLQDEGQPSDEIKEVRKAGVRASSLTRQLLTFSRKQINQPRVVDLNTITTDMEKMLRRLLGEDVELLTRLQEGLNQVMVDPGQIEQVVMNLAVNARDAMPDGGSMIIETANITLDETSIRGEREIEPGDYVMLAVSDNGSGIPEEHREKIFEPFYTTKEKGKGTGLGLSTVYGIVKQSEGHIWVYSEEAHGTTFKIYLPITSESARSEMGDDDEDRDLSGTETILLAEDEAWVRKLVSQCLEKQGYTVLQAECGEDAMMLQERFKGPIDMLLTDVVMPKMNGVELSEQLQKIRPDLRVLFMSGYTDHAALQHGRLPPDRAFLQKPFTIRDLAARVRDVLDRDRVLVTAG